jgi:hypothetical protein
MGLGVLVTESNEMFLLCSPGKSQLETRENDFFLRSGGRVDWRTSGKGGGGGSSFSIALNVAEASVKLFARTGMCTVGFAGAVVGRGSRSGFDVFKSGIGSTIVSKSFVQ